MRRLKPTLAAAALLSSAAAQPPEDAAVNGFGGFFFRAEEPEKLRDWYAENLGVTKQPMSYDQTPWIQAEGPTIFGPFEASTTYFGNDSKVFMLNFRTANLNALVEHLRANGNEVTVDPETYPNGRFARTADPEGNPIQLWQPMEASE